MMDQIEDETQEIKITEKSKLTSSYLPISLADKEKQILGTLVYMQQPHLQTGKWDGALHRPKKTDLKIF